jgi:hypothetical protein
LAALNTTAVAGDKITPGTPVTDTVNDTVEAGADAGAAVKVYTWDVYNDTGAVRIDQPDKDDTEVGPATGTV